MNENTLPAKTKLLYVYDAFCGWCYGFSPVITQLHQLYADEFDFDIISGGMVVDDRAGIIQPEMAEYILDAIPRVEEYTGIVFGEPHKQQLRDGTLYQSSVKPAVALCVFKSYFPQQAISFAAQIQKAFFIDGRSLEDNDTYLELLKPFNIDPNEFGSLLENDKYAYKAYQEFEYVQEMGITGFPALLGIKDKNYYWISKGFQPLENLVQQVNNFRDI